MEEYIGLDVSMKDTAVSIRRDGKRIWRGKCASDPAVIANLLRKHAASAKRVIFETGPLSVWFYHALCAEGLPADLYRCSPCQGCTRHGSKQDRRE